MVNLTIDGKQISVEENTTIMEAARINGIPIPKLCYLKGINEIAACRVCVVELEGKERLITSCNNVAEEGMVIYTNSPKVRRDRKTTVELILSQHDCECVTCARSGNCSLQKIANDLNIIDIPFKLEPKKTPWNKNFPLIRDSSKCIQCMRCIQICEKVQGLGVWDVEGTGSRTSVNVAGHRNIEEADCSLCGQCITHCPVGALRERDDTEKVWEAIEDKEKIVVAQVAPAVRTAWAEELGLKLEDAPVGKILDALKKMGADYVFDTTFSADSYDHGGSERVCTKIYFRRAEGKTDVYILLSGLAPLYQVPVPASGKTAFNGKIPAADVWRCYEDLFRRKTGCGAGEDLYVVCHAVCGKKRRAGDGTLLWRVCRT